MEKILCINNGMNFQGYLFCKSLSKYFEVDLLDARTEAPYDCGIENYEKYNISRETALKRISNYDFILALDQKSILNVSRIKDNNQNKKAIFGAHILDYPIHFLTERSRDYRENTVYLWKFIKASLSRFDVIAHNQEVSMESLKRFHSSSVSKFVRFPVKPIDTNNKERGDFIVYSGRLSADKGIINVLSALSLINKDIPFLSIGSGYDYSQIASHLRVNYKNINNCSEKNKWDLYSKSRFLVCGSDVPHIPCLSILEGISIGRSGIVFNSKENQLHYNGFVWYCLPNSLESFASTIEKMWTDKNLADERACGGEKWAKENCSYEKWAEDIYSLYEEGKK